jgi:hypothetical protein
VSVKLGARLPQPSYVLGLSSNSEHKGRLYPHKLCRMSCYPTSFRSRLSGDVWLSPSFWGMLSRFGCSRFPRFGYGRFSRSRYVSFPRFGHDFNRNRQFQLGRFLSAMVAMVQRLDVRSFFFRPQLSLCTVSAFVLEVFRNRFSCHGNSVAELSPHKLSNFAHSVKVHAPPRGDLTETYYPAAIDISPAVLAPASRPNSQRHNSSCWVRVDVRCPPLIRDFCE